MVPRPARALLVGAPLLVEAQSTWSLNFGEGAEDLRHARLLAAHNVTDGGGDAGLAAAEAALADALAHTDGHGGVCGGAHADHISSLDPWMGLQQCDSFFNCQCGDRYSEDENGVCHNNGPSPCLFGGGVGGTVADFLLDIFILLWMFKGLGEICDNYFMIALEEISAALELSNDVAGATFMAAGSSAPELFTSVVSTFFMVSEAGVGTIIGSAIFNIFVIVGATGFVACKGGKVLDIWWYPLSRDTGFYLLAIAELAIVLLDEEIYLWESLLMFFTYVLYIAYMKVNPWVVEKLGGEPGAEEEVEAAPADAKDDKAAGANGAPDATPNVKDGPPTEVPKLDLESAPEHVAAPGTADLAAPERVTWSNSPRHTPRKDGEHDPNHHHSHHFLGGHSKEGADADGAADAEAAGKEEEEEDEPLACYDKFDPISAVWRVTMPTAEGVFGKKFYWPLFAYSIFSIMLLSYLMVDSCIRMGAILRIDKLTMGLLVLAAGTSIPDTLASIAVAKQGEGNMAVANALGSNVFDILLGLGVPWTLKILCLPDQGLPKQWIHGSSGNLVSGNSPVNFPGTSADLLEWILILVVVVILFFGTLIIFKWKLNQKVGGVMLSMYLVYVTYALVSATVMK